MERDFSQIFYLFSSHKYSEAKASLFQLMGEEFQKILRWNQSERIQLIDLLINVYKITKSLPKKEEFHLICSRLEEVREWNLLWRWSELPSGLPSLELRRVGTPFQILALFKIGEVYLAKKIFNTYLNELLEKKCFWNGLKIIDKIEEEVGETHLFNFYRFLFLLYKHDTLGIESLGNSKLLNVVHNLKALKLAVSVGEAIDSYKINIRSLKWGLVAHSFYLLDRQRGKKNTAKEKYKLLSNLLDMILHFPTFPLTRYLILIWGVEEKRKSICLLTREYFVKKGNEINGIPGLKLRMDKIFKNLSIEDFPKELESKEVQGMDLGLDLLEGGVEESGPKKLPPNEPKLPKIPSREEALRELQELAEISKGTVQNIERKIEVSFPWGDITKENYKNYFIAMAMFGCHNEALDILEHAIEKFGMYWSDHELLNYYYLKIRSLLNMQRFKFVILEVKQILNIMPLLERERKIFKELQKTALRNLAQTKRLEVKNVETI